MNDDMIAGELTLLAAIGIDGVRCQASARPAERSTRSDWPERDLAHSYLTCDHSFQHPSSLRTKRRQVPTWQKPSRRTCPTEG